MLLIFTLSVFFSCQKDLSLEDGGTAITPPDLSTKISSSVSGFVTDENDAAVMNATVQFGTSNITTDKYGYFEAKNVQVVKEAAVVTVIKPGYFKGIKTYIAKDGKAAFFRIKLIPKTIVGNINAASGGTVTLVNGLSIKLPAGGIVNAATNIAYTGTVNVAAFWINPTATDLPNIMPGDLRGINTSGALKLLQTYGMAAVELTGTSGELLQIVNGQKATLTMPIPSSLAATAPATIPLWYFDEAKGLWKEEGRATKTGNTYTGDVNHFSFWDYGLPGNYVQFECTIFDQSSNPLSNVWTRVYVINDQIHGRYGFTDASGYVSGLIPANAQLVFEVYCTSTIICTPAHTQNLVSFTNNISLGNVIVTPNASWATIRGAITDCNNNPVTNGYAIVKFNNYYNYCYPTNQNNFIFYKDLCNVSSIPVDILAVDINNQQQNNFQTYTITGGNNNIGNVVACGNVISEFIDYSINGIPYSQTAPTTDFFHGNSSNWDYVYSNSGVMFGFTNQSIGVGSIQQTFGYFTFPQISDTLSASPPNTVNITEYGPILTGYIAGNFSGVFTGVLPPNTNYNITCNFRVRRKQ